MLWTRALMHSTCNRSFVRLVPALSDFMAFLFVRLAVYFIFFGRRSLFSAVHLHFFVRCSRPFVQFSTLSSSPSITSFARNNRSTAVSNDCLRNYWRSNDPKFGEWIRLYIIFFFFLWTALPCFSFRFQFYFLNDVTPAVFTQRKTTYIFCWITWIITTINSNNFRQKC